MKQTLIALAEDKPGVLNRIASLFRRRNFNIVSIVAGHSEKPGISRMTIVADENNLHKRGNIYFSLLKLVNVVAVKDVSSLPCVIRESILVKISAGPDQLNDLSLAIKPHGGRIVDMGNTTSIVEAMEDEGTIRDLLQVLEPFGILEISRTGKMAMRRGKNGKLQTNEFDAQADDLSWSPENLSAYHQNRSKNG